MAFTHLHVHTEYSLLDGAARIRDVVARAKELGMDSLAITDHGAMFGEIEFYKECRKQGIHPVLGCEIYVAPRTMDDRDPVKDKTPSHLVLLAETNEGYHNLCHIVSEAYIRGFYYKPRADKALLRKYSKGLICTSACLAGKVQRDLVNGDYAAAKQEAQEYIEIFGKDHYFLELQDQGLRSEAAINPQLKRLSEELGVGLVATNDVHYVRQSDREAHDVLLAIQTATTVNDPSRMRFPNDQFYLKSEAEMRRIFADYPEACDNTQRIAERCQVEIEFGVYHLPEFVPPAGKTNDGYLRELCRSGLRERYENVTPALEERLEYELSVIEQMGFVEYFLIVWDFIHYAKEHGIVVGPGRGSAAGSLVAYCLRITDIDPIANQLIFERFLNPERVSMPDIDVDFCIERRGEVIDYVRRKYGEDNVCQICTFGTLKAKAVVRDVGRALELTYDEADRIAKAIPGELNMTLEKALRVSPDLKAMVEGDDRIRKVIDISRALEGMPRHVSTHAAGVVISKRPVQEYVPLYMSDRGPATQYNMTTIEELGLLKMDFLGLRNLTVIRDALDLIERDTGERPDFRKIGYDDPGVYRMISDGNTAGIFQLESGGMTSFMKELRPSCFEDIVAGIALYRPGPMDSIPKYIENKKNPSKIRYVTPELAPILDVTYGCLIYQEQVMQIVRDLAGYSYGRSDLVRRAMSKKKHDVMMQEREYFIHGLVNEDGTVEIPGCIRNGISEQAAEQIFEDMKTFAEYAFNKSHAAAYAVVAYETAYLKVHHPVEFMAALLSSEMGNAAQTAKYVDSCRDLGIEILPPSVNASERKFTVENGKIRFGLRAVKNVGDHAIEEILRAREVNGLPDSIFSFIQNLDISLVNKKAVESLIRAGALDCFTPNRAAMLAVYESLMNAAQTDARRNISGQVSFFGGESAASLNMDDAMKLPDVKNFDPITLLSMEKEMLGIYLSGHPLDGYREQIRAFSTVTGADFAEQPEEDPDAEEEGRISESGYEGGSPAAADRLNDGMRVRIAGIVTDCRAIMTKRNDMMAFVRIEDYDGDVEIIVFPDLYRSCRALLEVDRIIAVSGRVTMRDPGEPKIAASSIAAIEDLGTVPPADGRRGPEEVRTESRNGRPEVRTAGTDGRDRPHETHADGTNETGDRNRPPVKVRIPKDQNEKRLLQDLDFTFRRYSGGTPVILYLQSGRCVRTAAGAGVDPTIDLKRVLDALCGAENVKMDVNESGQGAGAEQSRRDDRR